MFYNKLVLNWILLVLSFIIVNYNLYNIICSFSLFSLSYLHNFFYYILYLNDSIIDIIPNIYGDYVNLLILHWSVITNLYDYLSYEPLSYILNNFYLLLDCITTSSIYCIYFDTKVIGSNSLIFYALQHKIFIVIGETTLCFFRIINNSEFNIYGIPIYIISPFEYSSFITKVQCFCFEEIFIFPYEVIELPVLFYIDSMANSLSSLYDSVITIEYIFFCNYISS